MSDFTDQLEADALNVFLNQDEFGELLDVLDPATGTTYTDVKAEPQDLPDTQDDEMRIYHADGQVSGLSWAKGMEVTSKRDSLKWRVVSTGMNELGLVTIELMRPLARD